MKLRHALAVALLTPVAALAQPAAPSADAERETQIRAAIIIAQARLAILDEQMRRRKASSSPRKPIDGAPEP